jgi:ketosteroid isomerase-like protein
VSDDPIEIVRRIHEAFVRGDFDTAIAGIAEDVEWDTSWYPTGAVARGHDGVVHNILDWASTWDEYTYKPDEYRRIGDKVVVSGTHSGTSGGHELSAEHVQVWTIRDGKAVKVQLFGDRDAALRAAGAG